MTGYVISVKGLKIFWNITDGLLWLFPAQHWTDTMVGKNWLAQLAISQHIAWKNTSPRRFYCSCPLLLPINCGSLPSLSVLIICSVAKQRRNHYGVKIIAFNGQYTGLSVWQHRC